MTEILIAIVAAVVGGLLYTLIGIIPGTDETATMVPITIILVLAGLPAGALFAWEIGIIVAIQISHTIGLPPSRRRKPRKKRLLPSPPRKTDRNRRNRPSPRNAGAVRQRQTRKKLPLPDRMRLQRRKTKPLKNQARLRKPKRVFPLAKRRKLPSLPRVRPR